MRQYFVTKRIVDSKNVENKQLLCNKEKLKGYFLQTSFYAETATVDENGGYIVLDFGKEMCGGIKIVTSYIHNKERTATVHVRFGESLSEVYAPLGEKNSVNHHAVRDLDFILTGHATQTVGETGYRFVRIDFYPGVKVELVAIIGTNEILNKRPIYKYEGNDKRIKKIYETAKRTVDLCTSSGLIWDGIKRDRCVWIGDLYPETLCLTAMYGRVKEVEDSITFEREKVKFNKDWMCGLNTYNAWWVCCFSEYCLRTKNGEFTSKHLDYLMEQINLFSKYIKDDGRMEFPAETRFFVDWPCSDCQEDVDLGARYIFMLAMKKAGELLKSIGENSSLADSLYENLKKGNSEVKYKKQVIGLKYLALGEISDTEYQKLIVNGADGFSTFMSYPILTAIASRDKELAINLMKEYYGAMLDKGATTFWEDFELSWKDGSGRIDRLPKKGQKDIHGDFGKYCYLGFRHSLCHAWSSGVNAFIKENCD